MSAKTTKKTGSSTDMRSEYRLDYSQSKPNRFAAEFGEDSIAVVLDPDVASVFSSSESVNAFLRSVIEALPERELKKPSSR